MLAVVRRLRMTAVDDELAAITLIFCPQETGLVYYGTTISAMDMR